MINIVPLPALKDNYIWVLQKTGDRSIWIVDPGEAEPVIDYIEQNQLHLDGILITHHHWDHTNGLAVLQHRYPITPIYGANPVQVKAITHPIQEGDTIPIPSWGKTIEIMAIPGHTLDHTAYLLDNALFCGDTLFACGCGRIFEGTPKMMLNSLNKIKALPSRTLIYCGHEYTLANLQFALKVDPDNMALQHRYHQVEKLLQTQSCSLPSKLPDEWATNPFLRCDSPDIQKSVRAHVGGNCENTLETFAALREWKNSI